MKDSTTPRYRLLAGLALGMSTLGSWAQTPAAATEVVATVNGVELSRPDFERRLRQQEILNRLPDSPALRERVRQEMITEELLFQEAVRLNVDQSPAFVQAMENARHTALANVMLQSAKAEPVSDEQVRQFYEQSTQNLLASDFRLRVIAVDSQDKIRAIRMALAKGAIFAELARQQSQHPSAAQGGDIGWVNLRHPGKEAQGPLPAEVASEVRKLSKGGFTPPTADARQAWWLVKMEDMRPAQVTPLEQLKDAIRQALEGRARSEAALKLVSNLQKGASIKLTP